MKSSRIGFLTKFAIVFAAIFLSVIKPVFGENDIKTLGSLWPRMAARIQSGPEPAPGNENLDQIVERLVRWAGEAKQYKWFDAFVQSLTDDDLDVILKAAGDGDLFAREAVPIYFNLESQGQKTLLSFPFSGEMTIVQGNQDLYSHKPGTSNEFAWDFMRADKDGKLFKGSSMKNENYFSWEGEVRAPADGVVVRVQNDMPDHLPAALNPPDANCVWIDHGNGEVSRIYHLRKGSVRVREGDKISRGNVIGLIGDSGNSLYPHIHYQLDRLAGEGKRETIPARFCGYRASDKPGEIGSLVICGVPQKGEFVRSALPEEPEDQP